MKSFEVEIAKPGMPPKRPRNPSPAKILLKATSFCLIFSVLFVMVSYLLRPADEHVKEIFSGFYAEPSNSLDVAAYGGSGIYRYLIAPEIWAKTGLTTYFFASSDQPFYTIPTLIRETKKRQNPRLYLIEIRRVITSDSKLRQNVTDNSKVEDLRLVTDNLVYSKNRTKLINDYAEGEKFDWYFDLFHNHSNWKNLTLDSFQYIFYHKSNDWKGSYVYYRRTAVTQFNTLPYRNKSVELEASTKKMLTDVLDYCKSNKLNVLFLSTPYQETSLSIEEENGAAKIIEQYGYPYVNLNYACDDIGLDFSHDFNDYLHVNIAGALKVTKYFCSYLTTYCTPAHSQTITQKWAETYTAWTKEKKYLFQLLKENIAENP